MAILNVQRKVYSKSSQVYSGSNVCVHVCEWPPWLSPSSRSSSHLLLRNLKSISQLEWDDLHASCNLPRGDGMGNVYRCVWMCCICEGLTRPERANWVSQWWGLAEDRKKKGCGVGGDMEASYCRWTVSFHEHQPKSSPACSIPQHHPSAPIHSPSHAGPVREAKSPAANLIILCRCVSCSRNRDSVCLCEGDGE